MIIRNETASDVEAIACVTEQAFRTLQISRHTEQFVIAALREAGVLTVSRVAEIDRQVVGHIAFSPLTVSDGSANWYGLGPLSVLPHYHRQGIGRALVNDGLALLKTMGAEGCALVGDPAFYRRFGFRNIAALIYPDIPQEYFLVLPFSGKIPRGAVAFHAGFAAGPLD